MKKTHLSVNEVNIHVPAPRNSDVDALVYCRIALGDGASEIESLS